MRRSLFLAVPAAFAALCAPAYAQTPSQQPPSQQAPAPAAAAQSGSTAAPPLMTAPRPEDQTTTDPTASRAGGGGAAPSDEVQCPPGTAGTATAPVAGRPPGQATGGAADGSAGCVAPSPTSPAR